MTKEQTRSLVGLGCCILCAVVIGLIMTGAAISVTTHADKCSALTETIRAESKAGQFSAQATTLTAMRDAGC